MSFSIIVAIGENNLIGKGNELPWYYPDDLKYFKKTTLNHPVFMGYNTYLSIYNRLGKALPNRKNYVLTFEDTLPGDAIPIHDLKEVQEEGEVFVIGGKMIYEMMLPIVDKLYITHINKKYEGDVYFPPINYVEFNLISQTDILDGELSFCIYERKSAK